MSKGRNQVMRKGNIKEKDKKMLVDEYLDYHRSLVGKYGPLSIVLLQNGSFFEIYNYRLPDGPDIYHIADMLNLQVSRRDKNNQTIDRSNHEMAGFPIWAKQKFVQLLLNASYTIAIYVQSEGETESEDRNKRIPRVLDEIISPGINIDYLNQTDNNFLMSLYIESGNTQRSTYYLCGFSFIDLSIGRNFLYEAGSRNNDFEYGLDKTYEAIKTFNPKEVIVHLPDEDVLTRDRIVQHLELEIDGRVVRFYDKLGAEYRKVSFQNHFLGKVFPNSGMLTPIEYLNLERYPNAIISYMILLEFAKSHRSNITDKIGKPEILANPSIMNLTLNSMYQLSVLPDRNQEVKKNNSLLGILNNCCTAMGKRLYRHNLLHPRADPETLNRDYDQIELLLNEGHYQRLNALLHKIMDIERLHRRLALGIITPSEFHNLHSSYLNVQECHQYLLDNQLLPLAMDGDGSPAAAPAAPAVHVGTFGDFLNYIADYSRVLDLSKLHLYNNNRQIERSIFLEGIHPEIDELEGAITTIERRMESCRKQLSRLMDGSENMLTLVQNDKEGYFFTLTLKRSDSLQEKIKQWTFLFEGERHQYTPKDFTFKKGANNCKLFHTGLKSWGEQMIVLKRQMCHLAGKAFVDPMMELESKHFTVLRKVVNFVAQLDFITCQAKNVITYQLVRPTIDAEDGPGYIHVKGIRHLIVEQVQKRVPFIANDVELGNGHPHNILCYGYNAVGKTTLQKSISLAVIMAQSGGFVAAKGMAFRPFKSLFTRISNVDNLLKGHSSYMVEMLELKYILKHANNRSLVCIDELVASTESHSGISCVVATLKMLHDRKVCLFMATHLHQLAEMRAVRELPGLSIQHLEVNYDPVAKTLIYDRKLKEGPGSGLYGLEVARYLDLPADFLELAFSVRNQLLNERGQLAVTSHHRSHFNRDVVMDACQICKDSNRHSVAQPLEVHHINFQCQSDVHGNFESFHKNVDHNLVVVCKECHTGIHKDLVVIKGYRFTSNGIELDLVDNRASAQIPPPNDNPLQKINRRKYSDEQIRKVKELFKRLAMHRTVTTS